MPTPANIWLNITHTPWCQKVHWGRKCDTKKFLPRISTKPFFSCFRLFSIKHKSLLISITMSKITRISITMSIYDVGSLRFLKYQKHFYDTCNYDFTEVPSLEITQNEPSLELSEISSYLKLNKRMNFLKRGYRKGWKFYIF